MCLGERAPADGTDPSTAAPRIKAGHMEHMQARGLPHHIVILHTGQTYGAYIIMDPQLVEFTSG